MAHYGPTLTHDVDFLPGGHLHVIPGQLQTHPAPVEGTREVNRGSRGFLEVAIVWTGLTEKVKDECNQQRKIASQAKLVLASLRVALCVLDTKLLVQQRFLSLRFS